jgi:ubiquinone/menaquinone biosynthesis C-methylase UbiE
MLPRTLEPEVMDTVQEAQDYDSMDHSAVNAKFISDFLDVWNRRSPILDIGTGTAQIPIEFCRQSASGSILGIDAAESMLSIGRDNVAAAQFQDRIRLELQDAKKLSYPDRTFHAIMSNSIIHHIPEPESVFREIARLASAGATIFVRDLMRPLDEHTLQWLVSHHAAEANENQKRLFAESLRAALTLEEVRGMVARLGYDAGLVEQTSDRHWTWVVPGIS